MLNDDLPVLRTKAQLLGAFTSRSYVYPGQFTVRVHPTPTDMWLDERGQIRYFDTEREALGAYIQWRIALKC